MPHTPFRRLPRFRPVLRRKVQYVLFVVVAQVVAPLAMQRHISANAHVAMDQAEYQRQYDEYEARYHETQRRIAKVEARREALTAKRGKRKGYLDMLRKQGPIKTFNDTLWSGAVEQVRIKEDGIMRFNFRDGLTCR